MAGCAARAHADYFAQSETEPDVLTILLFSDLFCLLVREKRMITFSGLGNAAVQGAVIVGGIVAFLALISPHNLVQSVLSDPVGMAARLAVIMAVAGLANAALALAVDALVGDDAKDVADGITKGGH